MRVGLHHTAGVLEELASVRTQRNRQHYRREIRPASSQRRELPVAADALEAGDDRHQLVCERVAQRTRVDTAHLGSQVGGRGSDPGLGPGEGSGGDAACLESQRKERRGQGLAGRQRAVRLTRQRGVWGLS